MEGPCRCPKHNTACLGVPVCLAPLLLGTSVRQERVRRGRSRFVLAGREVGRGGGGGGEGCPVALEVRTRVMNKVRSKWASVKGAHGSLLVLSNK